MKYMLLMYADQSKAWRAHRKESDRVERGRSYDSVQGVLC